MFNRETDYALRVALALCRADQCGMTVLSARYLAREMDIPYRFLRKIVGHLARSGLITTLRGRSGGLSLRAPARNLNMLDVVLATAKDAVAINRCTGSSGACDRKSRCSLHPALAQTQRNLERDLRGIRLAPLAAKENWRNPPLRTSGTKTKN